MAFACFVQMSFAQTPASMKEEAAAEQAKVERLYSRLNKAYITSGILIDKGIKFKDPAPFSGGENSPSCNIADWLTIYGEIYRGRIYNTVLPEMLTTDEVLERVYGFLHQNPVPIGVLVTKYHAIKDDASTVEIPYFRMEDENGDILYDNPRRTSIPYDEHLLVAASPLESRIDQGPAYFVLPTDWLISNIISLKLSTIKADFGDGAGLQEVTPGVPVSVNYTSPGTKNIQLQFTQNGVTYYANTTIDVSTAVKDSDAAGERVVAGNNIVPISPSDAAHCGWAFDALWNDPNSYCEAYMSYGAGHTGIERPFIIAEGFDPRDEYNCAELYTFLNGSNSNFISNLNADGYDVIVLNFLNNGKQGVSTNASVLTRLIQDVNAEKADNGSTLPNVVGGVSMGAVIARYALLSMEDKCLNHEANLYISYDGPQQGANVPLSLQDLVSYAGVFNYFISLDAFNQWISLNSTAARELLVSHVGNGGLPHSRHTDLYNTLSAMGYPTLCRNISASLGVPGSTALSPALGIPYNPGDHIFSYQDYSDWASRKDINAWAVSTAGHQLTQIKVTAKILVEIVVLGVTLYSSTSYFDYINYNRHYTANKNWDNAPGGVVNTQQEVASSMGGTTFGRNMHCIIPVMSALDASQSDIFSASYGTTPFDAIFTHPATNRNHAGLLTSDAQTFLENEIDAIGTTVIGTFPDYDFTFCKCKGSEYDNANTPGKRDNIEIYKVVPGEMFVAIKNRGIMLKIRDNGGSGHNMFAINSSGNDFNSETGYDYLIGTQTFGKAITAFTYAEGYTFVGFSDGTIVKIQGTGGSGHNMFALTPVGGTFSSVPGYSYLVGTAAFASGVSNLSYIETSLFISFFNGLMLKIDHTGGTGSNLFAVYETVIKGVNNANPTGQSDVIELLNSIVGPIAKQIITQIQTIIPVNITSVPGYEYYQGDAVFSGFVTNIIYKNGEMIISFNNGKMLKVRGTGGTGHNMFAVTESASGFTSVPEYNYYIGDARFSGFVRSSLSAGPDLMLGFSNGHILKVAGTGGTGHNMFAVTQNSSGIYPLDEYDYFIGNAKYSGGITDMMYSGANTFISFNNGKLMKVSGYGGTGANMFNATENSYAFVTSSTSYFAYLVGSANFGVPVTDLAFVDDNTFTSIQNGKMLKTISDLGGGYNLFNVAQETTDFTPLCPYSTIEVGAQLLLSPGITRELEEESAPLLTKKDAADSFNMFPNPASSEEVRFDYALEREAAAVGIEIYTVTGVKVEELESELKDAGEHSLFLQAKLPPGIYLVNFRVDGNVCSVKKLVVQN